MARAALVTSLMPMSLSASITSLRASVSAFNSHLARSVVSRRRRRPHPGTRGDRLFISLLGSAFIFLAWLGIMGTPLWGPLIIAIAYAFAVFRWV